MAYSAIHQYQYHKWANRRLFDHLKELPDKIYHQQIKSVFSSVREVTIHIFQTDGLWLSVMNGDSFSETMRKIKQLQKKSTDRSPGEMQHLYEEMNDQYEAFLENKKEDLDTPAIIEHPDYGKLETSISEMVTHVVNHGTYHRGNITAMLRQQGHPGIPTDYIFYLHVLRNQ